MIDSLHGMIVVKTPEEVVVECGGVGYFLKITPQTAGILPAVGEKGFLYAHMQFSENDVSLYGFENTRQREMFRLLIGVSGVGPRVALAVLSALSSERVVLAVHAGDYKTFTAANGVGNKLAQRIVLELKDRVKNMSFGNTINDEELPNLPFARDASMQAAAALVNLGYSQNEAASAVSQVDASLPVGEIVRLALRGIGGR